MKITIHNQLMSSTQIILDTDDFDITGHVDVIICDADNSSEFKMSTVHINELYPAVVGLKAEYDESRKRDKE